MGWFGNTRTITTGEELDASWKKRGVVHAQFIACHKCGTRYELKPSATTCPVCGHTDDAQDCQACANEREYR
jgi:rubrerythrin